jgi:hypothetical protein
MSMPIDKQMSGGCLCGAVRYRLDETPFNAGYCHCRMCQLSSGAPAMVFASVHRDKLTIEKGQGVGCRSSDRAERWHCGVCSTPLFVFGDESPDLVDIAVVTLDEPEEVPPRFHIWQSSKLAWFDTADHLSRYGRSREED